MKRIRIHKDIANRIRVKTNGEYTPLAGRDIKLEMTDPKGGRTFEDFTLLSDGRMLFVYYGTRHKYTGTYQFTVWENYGRTGQTAVDCIAAFRLVPNTTLEGGEDPEGLDTEVNDLELDIQTGIGGGSGTGIASIEQTVTSTEDGGINEVTQTLTDGTTAVFQIRNGQRGSQGIQGEKGDAGEDWIPTQAELASIAQSAAALVDVPTKTSDLQNDSGFVTSNSPSFTGTPTAPTPVSPVSADSFQIANVEFVMGEMSAKVDNKIGQPNGIASLDSNGKVPSSQLPSSGGGGDTNVIEIVKVNGTALTPDSNKAVDVPVPTEQTVSGWGFTKNTGTYSKPSGGIPASDIASGVIPTVPTNVSSFTNDAHYVASTAITNIVSLTQAQYDALTTKDANTLYIIPES